jgi:protein-ribulosamine 3-kinase
MRDAPWEAIGRRIVGATGRRGRLMVAGAVPGGDINRTVRARLHGADYFIKLNHASHAAMFEAEARGLEELAASATLKVPNPVCHGRAGDTAYLVLEYLPLSRSGDSRALGAGLADMHRVTRAEYGWARDNAIGTTPQVNRRTTRWPDFWRRYRLGYQLELAAANGYESQLGPRGGRLMETLDALFAGYRPAASLLHGDLWAGNYAFTGTGEPVIFDPAVYFGDREADLAMTELFGGFSTDFHAAYRERFPLDDGYRVRKVLYNLYHVLNHLNLFGTAYLAQASVMFDTLLAELG